MTFMFAMLKTCVLKVNIENEEANLTKAFSGVEKGHKTSGSGSGRDEHNQTCLIICPKSLIGGGDE